MTIGTASDMQGKSCQLLYPSKYLSIRVLSHHQTRNSYKFLDENKSKNEQ